MNVSLTAPVEGIAAIREKKHGLGKDGHRQDHGCSNRPAAQRQQAGKMVPCLPPTFSQSAGLKTHRADMLGAPAAHHKAQRAGC